MNMKKLNVTLAILVAAVMAGNAQSTVTSDIVGYQSTVILPGLNAVGISLLNADTIKGSASGATSTSVEMAGQTNIGSLLTADEPYYIEVYSGVSKGDRFDVDVTATIASASRNIAINVSSPNNTSPFTSSAIASSDIVALRKHITIEQVKNSLVSGSGSWVGNNSSSSADQIQILDPTAQSFTIYYLRADGTTWRGNLTGTTPQNKAPIAPGKGVLINKKGSQVTLSIVGSVRNNDFAMPYYAGFDLKAPPVPRGFSPQSLGATAANGWTGNNSVASADQIQILNPVTQAFTTFNLRSDGTTWRGSLTSTTPQTAVDIINSDSAYLVTRRNGNLDGILTNPLPQN
jgi:hypothetical protein